MQLVSGRQPSRVESELPGVLILGRTECKAVFVFYSQVPPGHSLHLEASPSHVGF